MMANLLILPIVIPLAASILLLLLPGHPRLRRAVGIGAMALNLLAAGGIAMQVLGGQGSIMVLQAGDWPAPFGISIVVDALSAIVLCAAALVLFCVHLYCDEQITETAGGLFHPLFQFLAMGVQWSLITGDLFNLFVAFEIMLMASYALLVLGTSKQQMRHAHKYVLINLFGSILFVVACGLIYGHLGTLNLADLARLSHADRLPPAAVPAITLLLLVFGMKSALFPLWFWLPETYPTAPAGLGGLLGGLLTKVGAYVLIRIFIMVFGPYDGPVADAIRPILLVGAGVTMLLGVLGAVSMNSVRRILSIHIISQVGYMAMAIAIGLAIDITTQNRELAIAGGIFFIVHNMIVKSCLFLCGGLMHRHAGTDELENMGGLARKAPWLAALFFIAALSLAGLPPLSGFFGKFILIRETFRADYFALAGVALFTSVLTLLSMVKIWTNAFWSRPVGQPEQSADHTESPLARHAPQGMIGTGILVAAAIAMGLAAEPLLGVARKAARQAIEPSAYIDAVLGAQRIAPLHMASAPVVEDPQP